MDSGNFIIGSITTEQVLQAVDLAVAMVRGGDLGVDTPDYTDENVSTNIVKIVQSYTGIVNRVVWRKG
jgi:UDP-N-acetylglucosamine 2-epimerase (non-hydrolysing)